jgi:hypothetical protein
MPVLAEPEAFNNAVLDFMNPKNSRGRKTRHGKKAG